MTIADAPDGRDGADVDAGPDGDVAPIRALQSCPDRTVFTEQGNPDGWISTDTTVSVDD
jgi:hypothetical protein